MNFFNLDLHIGVIGDIKKILTDLGHSVTDWTLSGHSWATGRERDQVDVINHLNWRTIDDEMCDRFYNRYRQELDSYDAFIVTHTPCFAALYRRWNKPILVVASTRYEHPFTGDPVKWNNLNDFLRKGIDEGQIIPLANNKYDAAYAAHFTQRAWTVIPSLCEYTGMRYHPKHTNFLYWSKFKLDNSVPNLISKDSLAPGKLRRLLNRVPFIPERHGFDWKDVGCYRGIMHIPYNVSVMSIFEQYTANIPLFFPTERLMLDLMAGDHDGQRSGALSEISFNQVYDLEPGSTIASGADDPNDFNDIATVAKWLKFADFYDTENMPFINYFDSLDKLENCLSSADLQEISRSMRFHNRERKKKTYAMWEKLATELENNLS